MPKPGPRTSTRYRDEFRTTAVRLSELPACVCIMSLLRFPSIRSCCPVDANGRARARS